MRKIPAIKKYLKYIQYYFFVLTLQHNLNNYLKTNKI